MPKADIDAHGAEYHASNHMGYNFDPTIGSRGDGGCDFEISFKVDVVWLGVGPSGRPRPDGHLIVNPDEPGRWSDIYIVVSGDIDSGYKIMGWTTHRKLVSRPKKDFNHGKKFAMHVRDLDNIDVLVNMRKE